MSNSEIEDITRRLRSCTDELMSFEEKRIVLLEKDTYVLIRRFKELNDIEISGQVLTTFEYTRIISLSAEYHLARSLFYTSPGLFAIIAVIWGVIEFVYNTVKWVVDILHIRELLTIADILSVVWPAFRDRMNKIYGKIAEFSQAIGWGADGLVHLIQAAQGGVNILGGLMGKDTNWLEIKFADRAVDALRMFSQLAGMVEDDPGSLLDIVFRYRNEDTHRETLEWWRKTNEWIQGAADLAEKAFSQVRETIDTLQDLRNRMPTIVREHIPQSIWDALDWAEKTVDESIMPAISRIDRTIDEVNSVLDSYRKKTENLIEQILHPGDMLKIIDMMPEDQRLAQEDKIGEVASRAFEREANKYEVEDAAIMEKFEKISEAVAAEIPPPEFLALEEMKIKRPGAPVLEERETWFVGDY